MASSNAWLNDDDDGMIADDNSKNDGKDDGNDCGSSNKEERIREDFKSCLSIKKYMILIE